MSFFIYDWLKAKLSTGKETYRGPKAIDNMIVRCAPQLAELAKKMKERRDDV